MNLPLEMSPRPRRFPLLLNLGIVSTKNMFETTALRNLMLSNALRSSEMFEDGLHIPIGLLTAVHSLEPERGIAGVKNPPVPLRSDEFTRGLGYLDEPKFRSQKQRVERDTLMAELNEARIKHGETSHLKIHCLETSLKQLVRCPCI